MTSNKPALAVVVMGVCGTGKSTIGSAIARKLEMPYLDSDDFHPPANIAKLSSGIALTDADRKPWIDRLRGLLESHLASGAGVVMACSALRQEYREWLQPADGELRFIFLHGDRALLQERMQARPDHFMPITLLDSQLATLEVPSPADALWCNVKDTPDTIVAQSLHYLEAASAAS